jgi:hypothetical protein
MQFIEVGDADRPVPHPINQMLTNALRLIAPILQSWASVASVRQGHYHKAIFAHSTLLPRESLELREIVPAVVAVFISRVEDAGVRSSGAPIPTAAIS